MRTIENRHRRPLSLMSSAPPPGGKNRNRTDSKYRPAEHERAKNCPVHGTVVRLEDSPEAFRVTDRKDSRRHDEDCREQKALEPIGAHRGAFCRAELLHGGKQV